MSNSEPQVFNIAELFARDPREFTDEEFKTVVAELREARAKFVLGNRAAGAQKSLSPEQKKLTAAVKDIEL